MQKFNTINRGFLMVAALFSLGTIAKAQLPEVSTYINNFDGAVIDSTWKPEHNTDVPKVFTLTQSDGLLKVHVDKNTGINAGIGVYGFSALALDLSKTEIINLTENPFVRVRLKADTAFNFQVGAAKADSGTNNVSLSAAVPGDNKFHTYQFDFTGKFAGKYDPASIDKFFLNFNPGWAADGKYAGNVTFDFIKIGDAAAALPSVTSYVDNFDAVELSAFWVPEHANDTPKVFELTQQNGELNVYVDKTTGIDAGIGVYGFSALGLDMSTSQTINMKNSPFVQVKLKADQAMTFQIGPVQVENGGNNIAQNVTVPGDNTYHVYTLNFTGKFGNEYDSTLIDKFYFNFNPGWAAAGKYEGNVTFDYVKIGDAAVPTGISRNAVSAGYVVYPNPANSTIALMNVSAGDVINITITNMKGQIVKHINKYDGGFIKVEEFAAGIYNLSIRNRDNTVSNVRFVKQ
jgi:hypothetical protein